MPHLPSTEDRKDEHWSEQLGATGHSAQVDPSGNVRVTGPGLKAGPNDKDVGVQFKDFGNNQLEATGPENDYAIAKQDDGSWAVDVFEKGVKDSNEAWVTGESFKTKNEAMEYVRKDSTDLAPTEEVSLQKFSDSDLKSALHKANNEDDGWLQADVDDIKEEMERREEVSAEKIKKGDAKRAENTRLEAEFSGKSDKQLEQRITELEAKNPNDPDLDDLYAELKRRNMARSKNKRKELRKRPRRKRSKATKTSGGGGGKRKSSGGKSKTSGWAKLKETMTSSGAAKARLAEGGHTESYTKVLGNLVKYWEKRGK